jgi:hypothetical protein
MATRNNTPRVEKRDDGADADAWLVADHKEPIEHALLPAEGDSKWRTRG